MVIVDDCCSVNLYDELIVKALLNTAVLDTETGGNTEAIPRQYRTLSGRSTAPNTAVLALAYVQYRHNTAVLPPLCVKALVVAIVSELL